VFKIIPTEILSYYFLSSSEEVSGLLFKSPINEFLNEFSNGDFVGIDLFRPDPNFTLR